MRTVRGNGGLRVEILADGLPRELQATLQANFRLDESPDVEIREEALPVVPPNRPAASQRMRAVPADISSARLDGRDQSEIGGPSGAQCAPAQDSGPRTQDAGLGTAPSGLRSQVSGRPPRWRTLADAPEKYRKIAEARANILNDWQQRARTLAIPLDEAVDATWNVTASTLWNWKRRFDADGLTGLLPGWRGPESSIPQRAWDIFRGIYLDQNRPSATDAYERMLVIYARETEGDLTGVPDAGAFRRRIREIPEAAILLYRQGQKAYYDKAEPFLTRKYDMPSGDEFIADHHSLDFAARMADGKPGRLWLTVWIDRRSGKIVSRTLCERPSTDSVLASFAAAVAAHGCPLEAWMDCGKDFGSKAVVGTTKRERRQERRIRDRFGKGTLDESRVRPLMIELGVEPHFSIAYNARAKAIERTFGTLARTFSKSWPSYLGHNPMVKPESAKRFWSNPSSLPDYAQVLAELDKWIATYNAREHKSGRLRGLSADEAWEKFRGEVRPVRPDLLPILALRQEKPQLVKRNGVCLFGSLWFWNQELTLHLGREVVVRYNPGDLSRVWVFDIEGKLLVDVERSELANVSRQDVGTAMAAQRRARRAVRTQYAPPAVNWKIPVTPLTQPALAAAPKLSDPRGGRGEFDMSALDEELVRGLEKTG